MNPLPDTEEDLLFRHAPGRPGRPGRAIRTTADLVSEVRSQAAKIEALQRMVTQRATERARFEEELTKALAKIKENEEAAQAGIAAYKKLSTERARADNLERALAASQARVAEMEGQLRESRATVESLRGVVRGLSI